MVEWHVLGIATALFVAVGTFLRLVAKEARRREKHLILRLERERKAEEEAAMMDKNKNGKGASDGAAEAPAEGEPVTVN